ncbi:MAG TPA: type III-B CRISPR module RAMP protein Cmr6 [Acetobacteraceae bacterium]|nr:type III-B CRISPR module RAMP protein Cmr6 [Acetobacteraceae bacterium]
MRDAIRNAVGRKPASHFGHAYDMLAWPPGPDGKPDTTEREAWLGRCEEITINPDYAAFFNLWKQSFPDTDISVSEITARRRILIGHGNPSGADVGLTVHRTWGVPILPGSALKGLLAHYVDVVYGDDRDDGPGMPDRRAWRGPTWKDRIVASQAGAAFTKLFGTPAEQGKPDTARGGSVIFHDALYVPRPVGTPDKPFARDVLTVHQTEYYRGAGKVWPTDWDSPNPVGFLTIRPDAQFLLVLTGPQGWVDLGRQLLLDALREWGIGGKTAAGYGRLAQGSGGGQARGG